MTLNEKGLHASPVIAWFFFLCFFLFLVLCSDFNRREQKKTKYLHCIQCSQWCWIDFRYGKCGKNYWTNVKVLSQPLHYALVLRWSCSRINISFNLLRSRNKKRVIVTNFASSCTFVVVSLLLLLRFDYIVC